MAHSLNRSIAHWAEADQPREKLVLRGKANLSDAELIAILISSGSTELSAVGLSQKILSHFNNDLNELAKATVNDLMKFKGIGEAKAVTIVAALELGRRRKDATIQEKPKIMGSKDVNEYFKPFLLDLPHEEFWVLLLDRGHRVIKPIQISKGGLNMTLADPRIIFKTALEHLASYVILVHNHPSGSLNASQADLELTHKLVNAGKFLDIKVDDHLIFCNNGYLSLVDSEQMPN